ncbi:unnamed protein product [Acanthoscelides obtectus]|uniref:Uncharacterized protein n=1 Tax=Acanthoscelides obtectus TaxID=200917 RepID=A0A9P0Q7F2_ACAOB|nr:unnamed protein product [Acanthoscelides obtectus]CAK1688213.1 hypothetical protein AOBTE_LOCUS36614 [Acanthoscelides obtectus]
MFISHKILPSDPAKHIIWISLLGIDREKTLPKLTLICSKNFYDKDFENDLAGRNLLKDGADPLRMEGLAISGPSHVVAQLVYLKV